MNKIETNPHCMLLIERYSELLEKEARLSEVTKQRNEAVALLEELGGGFVTAGRRSCAWCWEEQHSKDCRLAAFLAKVEKDDALAAAEGNDGL